MTNKVTTSEEHFVDSLFSDEPVALVLTEHNPSDAELSEMEDHIDEYISDENKEVIANEHQFNAYELDMIEQMMAVLNREPVAAEIGYDEEAILMSDSEYADEIEVDWESVEPDFDQELSFD